MREHDIQSTNTGAAWSDRDAQTSSVDDASSMRELDRRLDQALEDTFPASDPVSIVMPIRNG